jgi:uncharacterized repeat protein (TIGR03803 family)
VKLKPLVSFCLFVLIVSLSLSMKAQTYSVIHSFTGSNGAFPQAGVTLRAGNLYGTTTEGGAPYANGNVYELARLGDNWVPSSLYIFTQGQDGYNALARPVFGPDGHLYGTFSFSPTEVFKLTPPLSICRTVNCSWKLDVVHLFDLQDNLEDLGYGDLVWDQQGNIYGTVEYGGPKEPYAGAVYELSPSGNGWVETPVYYFQGSPDAAAPQSGVILDKNGNLFGAAAGGAYGNGAIFELKYTAGVGWTESVIYSFTNEADGPPTGITFDQSGNLFGATFGAYKGDGGTVFELSPSGDNWTYSLLYTFPPVPGQSCSTPGPARPLTLDAAGNLYGTALCSGPAQAGSIFKLTNSQNGWQYTSLHDFTGAAEGLYPVSQVTIDSDGTLYGTTYGGGSNNCAGGCGVVWAIKP